MKLDETAHIKAKERFKTIEEECNIIHSRKYDYSSFIYKNISTKSTIICPTHGSFNQSLNNHLNGQECPKCARKTTIEKVSIKEKEFKMSLSNIHPNLECTNYISYKEKAQFKCSRHPELQISTTPTAILRQKHGCTRCSSESMSKIRTMTNETFKEKVINKHKNNIIPLEDYKGTKTPITFTCKRHNTNFSATPFDILQGRGCSICGGLLKYKKYLNEPTILYYIFIEDVNLYKIGITIQRVGIKYRMHGLKNYKILDSILFKSGKHAYEAEQQILKDYSEFKYKGEKIMHAGNNELFTSPIFNNCKISNQYLLKAEQ